MTDEQRTRNAALEEAAKVADEENEEQEDPAAIAAARIADNIRNLKTPEDGS